MKLFGTGHEIETDNAEQQTFSNWGREGEQLLIPKRERRH